MFIRVLFIAGMEGIHNTLNYYYLVKKTLHICKVRFYRKRILCDWLKKYANMHICIPADICVCTYFRLFVRVTLFAALAYIIDHVNVYALLAFYEYLA